MPEHIPVMRDTVLDALAVKPMRFISMVPLVVVDMLNKCSINWGRRGVYY